jgi:hypothetical protein
MSHLRWGSRLRLGEISSLRPSSTARVPHPCDVLVLVARVGDHDIRPAPFIKNTLLVLAATMLLPVAAMAADSATPRALAVPRARIESADYRASGHMVRVQADGVRVSYPITIKAHWFPGVLRVQLEIGTGSKYGANPVSAAFHLPAHILLEMRPGGKSTILVAHPGDKTAVVLPFDKWSEGPLGNEFSYEDFLEAQYFWAGQTVLGAAKFGARDCDQLKSTPGATDKSHYIEVTSWLDRAIGFPVYMEKTLKDGTVKEFSSLGLRQESGVWSAHQIEVKLRGHAGSTLLIIDRGAPHANLGLKDFSAAQLTHF